MQVWLNGEFVDRDRASISVFDAGVQHGVGLFETMIARNGGIFRPEAHMDRLARSARELLLTERLRIDSLVDAMELVMSRSGMGEARLRLTLTGGNLNMLQSENRSQVDPTILIVAQPPTRYPEQFFAQGVVVLIADGRDNPFSAMSGHKTLNYWPRIRALQLAAGRRAAEAIWFTVSNHLSAGSVSNIFLVKDRTLLTPIARGEEEAGAIASTVLPGITRAAVIELADSLDVPVERRMLDINDLLAADEVFLTNSSWGVLPVVGVEREMISQGAPGEVTRQVRDAWLALVDAETQAASL